MKKTRIKVKVADLQLNEGQLPWLPKNPRQWTQDDIDKMCESLQRDPDFMEDNPLDITPAPQEGQFVVFCGNLRTTGLGILGVEETDAYLYIPEKTPDPEKDGKLTFTEDRETVKRRAILDNGHYGAWDSDTAAEWGYEAAELQGFGVPGYVTGFAGSFDPSTLAIPTGTVSGESKSGMESITIVFTIQDAQLVKDWIREHSKADLATKIVELCQSVEAK